MVQALLFADGGLSALGLNVLNMAIVGAWGGYLVFLGAARAAAGPPLVGRGASAVAAALAPVLAALLFTVEYAIGGNGAAALGTVAAAMVGVHVLIGIGEGIITALTVSAVMATRPDLVYGARDLAPAGRVSTSTGELPRHRRCPPGVSDEGGGRPDATPRRSTHPAVRADGGSRRWTIGLVGGGLLVALLLAFFVSPFASSSPDGLEKVAADQGHRSRRAGPRPRRRPAGRLLGSTGVDDARLSTGLAGVVGVAVTFAIGGGLFLVVRRSGRRSGRRCDAAPVAAAAADRHRHPDMSGGRAAGFDAHLYVPGSGSLYRVAPECKVAATVLFVLAVVAAPREAFWAYGVLRRSCSSASPSSPRCRSG